MAPTVERLLLTEALPLLVTYTSGPDVELRPWMIGTRLSLGDQDEIEGFTSEFRTRHALASAMRLGDMVRLIETRPSSTTAITRDESRGVIRGRLDVSRYLARRLWSRGPVPRYPILVTTHTPRTPENTLVRKALKRLVLELGSSPFASATAEGRAVRSYRSSIRMRLRSWPWDSVPEVGHPGRLRQQAEVRIRKHQTGNDAAYAGFLRWLAEYQLEISKLGDVERDSVIEGIMAFPAAEQFWERIFEVWCLQEIAESLTRVGMERLDGPRPLYDRRQGAIYRFGGSDCEVSVWFQTQRPLGSGRWHYHEGGPFRGIPDIVLQSDGRPLFLWDAKYRWAGGEMRSEETYKMLGYAENFREAVGERYWGALMFPGGETRVRYLESPEGGRISVLVLDPTKDRLKINGSLDDAIRAWLSQPDGS